MAREQVSNPVIRKNLDAARKDVRFAKQNGPSSKFYLYGKSPLYGQVGIESDHLKTRNAVDPIGEIPKGLRMP